MQCAILRYSLLANTWKSRLAFRTRPGAGLEYAVYFLPRRTIACERIFEEEGVYGDIVAGEFPLGFIPFDYDLLSLEQGSAFRVRHLICSIGTWNANLQQIHSS